MKIRKIMTAKGNTLQSDSIYWSRRADGENRAIWAKTMVTALNRKLRRYSQWQEVLGLVSVTAEAGLSLLSLFFSCSFWRTILIPVCNFLLVTNRESTAMWKYQKRRGHVWVASAEVVTALASSSSSSFCYCSFLKMTLLWVKANDNNIYAIISIA